MAQQAHTRIGQRADRDVERRRGPVVDDDDLDIDLLLTQGARQRPLQQPGTIA
jgi:hypothetical protein